MNFPFYFGMATAAAAAPKQKIIEMKQFAPVALWMHK